MEFRDTPIDWPFARPEPRQGGFASETIEAMVGASKELLARMAEPDALAVTTGHQPVLFTGPLYTVHKALSAKALARALERRWERPVVPVFWVAADDHDYREVAGTSWLGTDGSLVSVELPPRPDDAPLRPMYAEPVPPEAVEAIDRLADTTTGADRDWVVDWLRRHYQAGATLGDAAGGAMAELLSGLGIACVDGSATSLKRLAWPVVRRSLVEWDALHPALLERAVALEAAGQSAGVKVDDGATLVMLEAGAGRDRLLPDGDAFVTRRSGERFTLEQLDQIAAREPRRISANVLLRPVVESVVLPTVAYLAGPGELRYLELASALYRPLDAERQRPLPRWSGAWIEPRIVRTAAKLDLTLDAALAPDAEADLARTLVPDQVTRVIAAARDAIDAAFERVVEAVISVDPTLEKPARSTAGANLNNLAQLEKRVTQAATRKQGEALEQLQRIRTALAPSGGPQERVVGVTSFLARYGRERLADLAEHVEAWYEAALVAVESPT
ncbi:MAG: bacillithiol biosynthesis cysteine-adding enzyme BshC [Gemmatimonadales bacterium]